MSTSAEQLTRVVLAFVPERVNNRLRFGNPVRAMKLDRWRHMSYFPPGAVFCRVCWLANGYGTAVWNLSVLQAGRAGEPLQRMAGVMPGARRLLHASSESKVRRMLQLIDEIDAVGIDLVEVSSAYWQLLQNRLAIGDPLPRYTLQRHAAHMAGDVFR